MIGYRTPGSTSHRVLEKDGRINKAIALYEAGVSAGTDTPATRRLFLNEPGVVVICFPRRGRRVYRTLRIPENVFQRVLTMLTKVA
jgi:hypothetical protein